MTADTIRADVRPVRPVLAALACAAALALLAGAWLSASGGRASCRDLAYRDPVTGRTAAIPPARVTPDGHVACPAG